MNQKFRPLLDQLYSGKVGREEFIRIYFQGSPPNENDCLELLRKGLAKKDSEATEDAIITIFIMDFKSRIFTNDLCELLHADWHTKHEDIATLLGRVKDLSSIECLYGAAQLKFDYLDYDDTYQFARKCIKALSSIGNATAIDKLKILAKSANPKISQYAEKELNYIKDI